MILAQIDPFPFTYTHTHRDAHTHTHTCSCARLLKTQTRQAPLNNPLNLQPQLQPRLQNVDGSVYWVGFGSVQAKYKSVKTFCSEFVVSFCYLYSECIYKHTHAHQVTLSGLYTTSSSPHTKKSNKNQRVSQREKEQRGEREKATKRQQQQQKP